ncbi:hypothetical protein JY651_12635 [Pyxidicoccus parkwayensis]|uniref:Lipoprotein n=1 Tax=Pyxidicoccus parkwayensis TaxID=2813578 RepID=A0ABX7P5E3_9BACT|nr:hypothetical protein [Pyxidicoccus parkwaysis]QSQ25719.1 hypothetical protein JY651_12635 [Pyxidicoccus parkwaysis]
MRKFNFSLVAIALLMAACGGAPVEKSEPVVPQAGEGVVQLPMTSTTSEGVQYRLVGATFAITGPKSVNISDTSPDTVSVVLPAGAYSIRLEGQWHLERTDAPGQTVQASLISPNPMAFSLDEGQTRAVRFIFKTPGNATADVGITVDTAGWMAGTLDFDPVFPGPPNILEPLGGTSLPFVISWSTSTVTRVNEQYTKFIRVETGPITVQFGGPYSTLIHDRIAPSLQGARVRFDVFGAAEGVIRFSNFELFREGDSVTSPFLLEMADTMVVSGVVDEQQMPAARPFTASAPVILRSYQMQSSGFVRGTANMTVSAQ